MALAEDFIFITIGDFEGVGKTHGYIPTQGGNILGRSGVTIGTGIDLGQQTEAELLAMRVPASIVGVLRPYLGLQKEVAQAKLHKLPLHLSQDAVALLDVSIMRAYIGQVQKRFDADSSNVTPKVPVFSERPKEVQAVAVSLAYQLGLHGFPKTWGYLVQEKYSTAVKELRTAEAWHNQYMPRRKAEANILAKIVSPKGNLWATK